MADVELHHLREGGDGFDRLKGEAVAGMDFEPEGMGEGGHFAQGGEFFVAGFEIAS